MSSLKILARQQVGQGGRPRWSTRAARALKLCCWARPNSWGFLSGEWLHSSRVHYITPTRLSYAVRDVSQERVYARIRGRRRLWQMYREPECNRETRLCFSGTTMIEVGGLVGVNWWERDANLARPTCWLSSSDVLYWNHDKCTVLTTTLRVISHKCSIFQTQVAVFHPSIFNNWLYQYW
jgi:hypothetical protein